MIIRIFYLDHFPEESDPTQSAFGGNFFITKPAFKDLNGFPLKFKNCLMKPKIPAFG